MKRKSFLAYPYVLWGIIFTVIPLLIVAFYAFTVEQDGHFVFSTVHIKNMLNLQYYGVFVRSIWLAVVSTLICLIIGYPMAMAMASKDMSQKQVMAVLIMVPMWMNFLLRTYAWMSILEKNGIINSFLEWMGLPAFNFMYHESTVVLGMVYNFLPFMILPIYNILLKTNKSLIEAAQDLGANPLRTFTKITFPLSLPGVLSGVSMVFMPAVSTFVISRLLGGGNSLLIGDLIEQQYLQSSNWGLGSALSLGMMLIILITMTFMRPKTEDTEGGMLM